MAESNPPKRLLERIPNSFRELLGFGLVAYCMIAGLALLCNLSKPDALAVFFVLLIGLVVLLLLEAIAAGLLLLLLTFRRS